MTESELSHVSKIDSTNNSVFESTRDMETDESVNTTGKSLRGGRRTTRGRATRKRKSSEAEVSSIILEMFLCKAALDTDVQ